MIGFCLAAGAGTRLAPLTRVTPKALLAPAGRPLVDLAVEALQAAGATRVVVNAHHGADQLAAWLSGTPERPAGPERWPRSVRLLREERLLGTGGGLANAARRGLLDARVVLVTCADHVVVPADLARLAGPVARGEAEAVAGLLPLAAAGGEPAFTLAARSNGGPAPVRLDPGGAWASAGVYAVAGRALADRFAPAPLPDGREVEPSSLVEALLEPLWRAGRLAGMPLDGAMADAGTLDRFLEVAAGLLAGRWPYRLPPGRRAGDAWIADGAAVDPEAELRGTVVVDRGATVGAGARVTGSVLGAGSVVAAGATVSGSVLGPGARLSTGEAVEGALVAAVG